MNISSNLLHQYLWQFILLIYFTPTIICLLNKKSSFITIFICNLLGGWTVIFWIGTLILAFTDTKSPRDDEFDDQDEAVVKNKKKSKGVWLSRYVDPLIKWHDNI